MQINRPVIAYAPPGPPDREELINILCDIIAGAKMPPGRMRSDTVKVSAALVKRASSIIAREKNARIKAELSGNN